MSTHSAGDRLLGVMLVVQCVKAYKYESDSPLDSVVGSVMRASTPTARQPRSLEDVAEHQILH